MTSSSKLTLGAESDHLRLARLLRRAHAIALDTGVAPAAVRQVVSESWRRSVEAGVNPERPATRVLDTRSTSARLAVHPVEPLLSRIRALLREALVESGYFFAVSDADGVLLWTEGSSRALRSAEAPRFLPGFLCSEDGVGTNAIGTALALDQPVQIYSAEHFSRLLHGWTCAAAPIHDPHTGEVLGAIDLSGDFRTAHLHGLPLVRAVAIAAEAWLAAERRGAEEVLARRFVTRSGSQGRPFGAVVTSSGRVVCADPPGWLESPAKIVRGATVWPQGDGCEVEAEPVGDGYFVWRAGGDRPSGDQIMVEISGRRRAVVSSLGDRLRMNLRHSEILALLALHPEGMTVRDLALAIYGSAAAAGTVRAEIARLRRRLGAGVVLSRPYRFPRRVATDLHEGDGRVLLPESKAPGIVSARRNLGATFEVD